jgi:hypothetical protein
MQTSAQRAPEPTRESICVNCGDRPVAAFCAGCGQRTPTDEDYSVRTFARAALGHVTNYDGRLLSTLKKLFLRPGQLARDHFEGRRAQHLDPFRIFVLSNLAAWFVIPHTTMFGFSYKAGQRLAAFSSSWMRIVELRARWAHLPVEKFAARIDAVAASENPMTVLCLVPFMTLGLWALLAGRGFRYVQHLVFTAHLYCIHLCCVVIYFAWILRPLIRLLAAHSSTAPLAPILANIWSQHFALAPPLMAYLYFGIRRAYLLTPRQAAWRAIGLGLWACLVTRMFFDMASLLVLIWA